MISLDSADLYADDGGPFDPGMTSGHAVVLTGIDDGPPAYVYINDPAFSDGAGVQIPLEQFMDAWQDSECARVSIPTTDTAGAVATADDGEPAAQPDAAGTAKQGGDRILLLPLTLLYDAARDVLGLEG